MFPDISLFLKVPSYLHLFHFFHNTVFFSGVAAVFTVCLQQGAAYLGSRGSGTCPWVGLCVVQHHHWLCYCLAALASIHARLSPPTVLCTASAHYELQRLPCAALFIKVWRWSDFGHHCCTRSAHINIHEAVVVWLCVWLIQLFKPSTSWEPAKRRLLLFWFIRLSRSQNVADFDIMDNKTAVTQIYLSRLKGGGWDDIRASVFSSFTWGDMLLF